jgi:hypothetical protein
MSAVSTCVLLALATPAHAQFDIDEQNADYLYRFFADSDDVHVYSHYGSYGVDLDAGASLWMQYNRETVIVPAVDAPVGSGDAVDAITTASRPIADASDAYTDYAKGRDEVQGDLSYGPARAGYYVSKESDYFAQQVRGGVDHDLFAQHLNLAVGVSYGWDAITPLVDEDTATADDERKTTHMNLVATHVLTRRTLVRVGAERTQVKGLQHSPYRNVYAGGGTTVEVHPDARLRQSGFVRLQQYFGNQSSVRGDYRYYTDDWGVRSHTWSARLHQYVIDDLRFRYRYRYYRQNGAEFYRDEYESVSGVDGYLTGDYRLAPLRAHLFGGRMDMSLSAVSSSRWLRRFDVSFKYERYFNSNNFSANILETGFAVRF